VHVYGVCACYDTQNLCSARSGSWRERVSGKGVLGVSLCGCMGELVG